MGLIKALTSSTSSVFGDQFKEFVECPQIANDVIIQRGIVKHGEGNKKYSEGIISNGSTIAVPQGMAMMIVDNGKIVEFTAESGTYTWDTSSESSVFTGGLGKGLIDSIKTLGKRITYGGQEAKDQRVYFVNIKTIPGQLFGSSEPELVSDPVYGSVEITYNGEYAIRVDDPIILINNIVGATPKDTLTYDDIFKSEGRNMLKGRFAQKISEAISNIMVMHNVSFNKIQLYKSDITEQMNKILDKEWHQKYGIIVEDVTLRINAPEEFRKKINEMDMNISQVARMGEVYSNNMAGTMAAASAEAMKTAAGNESGSMMGFMGMNMANMTGNTMMGTVTQNSETVGVDNKTENNIPTPGTIFKNDETVNINTLNEEIKAEESVSTNEISKSEKTIESVSVPTQEFKFCTNCGTPTSGGNFCGQCGNKLK